MILADAPGQQPFVDALARAVTKVGGRLALLAIDGRQHIVALVDNEMLFFQIGLLVGEEARLDPTIDMASESVGRAMATRADGTHCGYWTGLTGHEGDWM